MQKPEYNKIVCDIDLVYLFESNIFQNPFRIWGFRFLLIGSCFSKLENSQSQEQVTEAFFGDDI
jgi:hypothetical protein